MDIEEVMDIAVRFLTKSGYPTYKLLSIKLDHAKKEWKATFDVGFITTMIISLTIDDASGRIIAYDRT